MSHAAEIERYAKDPGSLVNLCREVIERLDGDEQKAETAAMEAQLREIARAIEKLEKQGVPVPDALRGEKTRLISELANQGESLAVMNRLAAGIEEVLLEVRRRCGREQESIEKKPSRKRSWTPKTGRETLREYILKALRKFGGSAHVREVLEEMGNQLEGKLLPGDLEWRESSNEYTWRNNARWERNRMVKDGLLRSDSPVGTWELNEDE